MVRALIFDERVIPESSRGLMFGSGLRFLSPEAVMLAALKSDFSSEVVQVQVNAAAAGFSAERLELITDHMERNYMAPGKIPGCQIMVSRAGQPAYFRSFGNADTERARPVADDTIFRIYSMSKPITSVALMMLYEEGRFQLNDPVHRFLPAWKNQQVWVEGEGDAMVTRPPESPVTVRHLLTHTAGLTYGSSLVPSKHPVDKAYQAARIKRDENETIASFGEKLGSVPLRFEPGTSWEYSYATDVCGCLVEAISGQPFAEFLQQRLFTPLGMRDTGFVLAEEDKARFAACYVRRPDKTLAIYDDPEDSVYSKHRFPSGGGGLLSTTADYARFCEMLRCGGALDGERILGSRTLRLMTRNHLVGGAELSNVARGSFSETAYDGVGFGLGFATTLDEVRSGTMGAGDYYWGGLASTIFWVDPVEDLFVIFMTQLVPSATFNFRGQLKNIVYGALEG